MWFRGCPLGWSLWPLVVCSCGSLIDGPSVVPAQDEMPARTPVLTLQLSTVDSRTVGQAEPKVIGVAWNS